MTLAGFPNRTKPQAGVPLSYGMATSAVGAPPVAPTPLASPTLPQAPAAPGFTFTPPTVGQAPTPTPTGAFTAPDPSQVMNSPAFQLRLNMANRGAERSAAARGTLLSGGFQGQLARLNQDLASQEYDKIYGRSLSDYTTNRDTTQANFGNALASYTAGTGASLDAGRLGLAGQTAAYDRTYGAQRDALGDARLDATTDANVLNVNSQARDLFDQQMADYRAQVDAQRAADMARQNAETTRSIGGFAPRAPLPGQPRVRTHA